MLSLGGDGGDNGSSMYVVARLVRREERLSFGVPEKGEQGTEAEDDEQTGHEVEAAGPDGRSDLGKGEEKEGE